MRKVSIHIIRYSTHSCLDPSRSKKIVRYPGVLIYNKRCAVIATRLKKRDSKRRKRKRNWVYHRLLLPPKVYKKKVSSKCTSNEKGKVDQPVQKTRKYKKFSHADRLGHENVSRKDRLKHVTDHQECKPSKGFLSDSLEHKTDQITIKKRNANLGESKSMPLSDWKIVLLKKDEVEKEPDFIAKKSQSENSGVDDIQHEECEQETVRFVGDTNDDGHVSQRKVGPLIPIDLWQSQGLEHHNCEDKHFRWNFPVLPTRTTALTLQRGVLFRKKYPFHEKPILKSLVAFEVLAHKANLHPRLENRRENGEEDGKSHKVNYINIDLGVPCMESTTDGEFVVHHDKVHLKAAECEYDAHVQVDEKLHLHDNSSSAEIQADSETEDVDSLPIQDARFHLQNPVIRKLLNSDKWSSTPSPTKSRSTKTVIIGRQNNIVKNILRTKQWVSNPRSSNVTTNLEKLNPNSKYDFSDEEIEKSLFADDEPKLKKKKKRSGRKKHKKGSEREPSAKSGPFESASDILDNDIYSELMRLYIPRDNSKHLSSDKEGTSQKRKRKRRRTASKKKDDPKNSLREDLLVSLKRNTAYWYEVTSRLQNVSEKPGPLMEESQMQALQGKKNLKEAVQKAFPNLKKGKIESINESASRSSSPRLPPIDNQKPHSKFYKAAAAVVNAEKNYYSILPPLKSSWSEALEDLLPSLALDSEDSGLGGEKKANKKKASKRGGKKKGEEGGLDDPGQTAVSTVSDSRAGSSKRSSGSPHSSKPTSARSSKSSSAHRRMHDPLSYDPKQFLGDRNPPEDESELVKLQETLGGGGAAALADSEVFWFNLPRSPSHRAAIFTLPVQIKRLKGLTTVDYLKKYMRLRTSRKQLYSMVFLKHRDMESIRIERLLVSDFAKALGDALGGQLTDAQLTRLKSMVTLPEEALDKDFFVLIAAFAERLFCFELLAAQDVEIEPRDLVEQLDFQQLDERLQEVTLDPLLHHMLTTIRDLG